MVLALPPGTLIFPASTRSIQCPSRVTPVLTYSLGSMLCLRWISLVAIPLEREDNVLLLIIMLVLLFGGGGGYYGYSRWGTGGGLGVDRPGKISRYPG